MGTQPGDPAPIVVFAAHFVSSLSFGFWPILARCLFLSMCRCTLMVMVIIVTEIILTFISQSCWVKLSEKIIKMLCVFPIVPVLKYMMKNGYLLITILTVGIILQYTFPI